MTGTISVDFDGVIHAYTEGWQDGTIYDEPIPHAFDAIRALMEDHAVYIHTSRDPIPVAEWIRERSGIPTYAMRVCDLDFWNDQNALLVTSKKLPAIAYIDDRAVRFATWDQALADLQRLIGDERG